MSAQAGLSRQRDAPVSRGPAGATLVHVHGRPGRWQPVRPAGRETGWLLSQRPAAAGGSAVRTAGRELGWPQALLARSTQLAASTACREHGRANAGRRICCVLDLYCYPRS